VREREQLADQSFLSSFQSFADTKLLSPLHYPREETLLEGRRTTFL
jgi:hypothetical protein